MVSVPAPSPRRRRPDYRAEKLLKHLPGNEKEMDRYVDRFFTKYNWCVVVSVPFCAVALRNSRE